MAKILVTGATGQLGKEVVNGLIQKVKATDIAVLVRDAAKAKDFKDKGIEVKIGSYDDYQSLVNAFNETDKLYFVSGSEIPHRVRQHKNIVNAAKEAGVKHVIYTSFQRKNDDTASSPIALVAEGHLKAEEELKASGIAYTILKHGLYADMLPIFMGEQIIQNGLIYQPAGEGKAAYVVRKDLAELGVAILTSDGHENKVYEAIGIKAYSYAEIAKILSGLTGKTINYVSPSRDEFVKTLTGAGVPIEYVSLFADFSEAIRQGEFEETSIELEKLLGRRLTTVEDYLSKVYSV